MSDANVKDLLKKLMAEKSTGPVPSEDGGESEEQDEAEEPGDETGEAEELSDTTDTSDLSDTSDLIDNLSTEDESDAHLFGRGERSPSSSHAHLNKIRMPADQVGERSPSSADDRHSPATSATTATTDLSSSGLEDTDTTDTIDLVAELTATPQELLRRRTLAWAMRAVEAGNLLKKPAKKADLYQYELDRKKVAEKLVKQVLGPGEFYLVRRGGTRKGSGTFYTRPQLAVPITRHTLEPLLYTTREDGARIPRVPAEILNLKVCDPACGSASFLVAALHAITDALYESLVYYKQIDVNRDDGGILVTLPLGAPSLALQVEELQPVPPDDPRLEPMTKARLRRYVVERCLYGVDLSPLAVELARMSLWIETMDRELPFTFLDHKIRVGNALVGAWFDTFREYPIMAWERDGGDTGHTNGFHYNPKEWTQALKQTRTDVIKPALIKQIEASGPQLYLLAEEQPQTPENLHTEITTQMERIHTLAATSVQEQEEYYLALRQRPAFQELKYAFDAWCAAWFWPADELAEAPTPTTFYNQPPATRALVESLASDLRFFHWELEFPEVFERPQHGFDAVLANPPWEISKPISKEFFSDYDPLYRTYGKQEALRKQKGLFQQDRSVERAWLSYSAFFKSMSNWAKHTASPFGDPTVPGMGAFTLKPGKAGAALHTLWRQRRSRYYGYTTDENFPLRYQGSADLNTYKMFLEVAHYLLRPEGRLGMLVPSGVYSDQGSTTLRRLFLDQCRWEWLFGFFNRLRIFEIDSRFKFAMLLLSKGNQTDKLNVVFNHESISDLDQPERFLLDFPRQQITRFSPRSWAIIELASQRDLAILDRLYTNTVLLGDESTEGWQIDYATEFHMTNDSRLFPPLPDWQARGYRPDGYGRWVDSDDNVALPLYEGRMIGAFDPSNKGWVQGKGRSALWRDIPLENKVLEPQYLMSFETYKNQEEIFWGNKIGFMDIASATNTRSMYASLISNMPCGNVVPVLQSKYQTAIHTLSLLACFNSFVYDYAVRCRLGGLHLNYFVVSETPLIPPSRLLSTPCALYAGRLNLIMPCFAPQWLELREAYPGLGWQHWRRLWAITRHERLRLRCILDALLAELYGLEYADFAWILRDDRTNLKGFWRVDKDQPVELRHTTLALAAFSRLKEVGMEAFLKEDWQFPPEVAAQLGPRFTSWQEEGSVADSWEECEMHAQRMKETPIPLPELAPSARNSSKRAQKQAVVEEKEEEKGGQLGLWSSF